MNLKQDDQVTMPRVAPVESRLLALAASAVLISASAWGCSSDDVGSACNTLTDCQVGLICDLHGGRGTCQKEHGHEAELEQPSDAGARELVSDAN